MSDIANSLRRFGRTRTVVKRDYAFIAPDSHVTTALPGWTGTGGVILISPQMGARLSHYFAHMEPDGRSAPPPSGLERFIYVVEGSVELSLSGDSHLLGPSGYAYIPPDAAHQIRAAEEATLNIFERRYLPVADVAAGDGSGHERRTAAASSRAAAALPEPVVGREPDVEGAPFLGDPDLTVRTLLPADERFDMAVNTMTFKPGTPLPFAESHFMQHGMLMLTGGGVYRLGEDWHPIQAGDVLWMGPYCPQWFGALGKEESKYLLYKETNRDPFRFAKESL